MVFIGNSKSLVLPDAVSGLCNLRDCILADVDPVLPEGLGHLPMLRRFELSNSAARFPTSFTNLSMLTHLLLDIKTLRDPAPELRHLPRLRRLDMAFQVPVKPARSKIGVEKFFAGCTSLTALEINIGDKAAKHTGKILQAIPTLTGLMKLEIESAKHRTPDPLPTEITKCSRLTALLIGNVVDRANFGVPSNVLKLPNLRHLAIDDEHFWLPVQGTELKELRELLI
jgi:hypothetical protein